MILEIKVIDGFWNYRDLPMNIDLLTAEEPWIPTSYFSYTRAIEVAEMLKLTYPSAYIVQEVV